MLRARILLILMVATVSQAFSQKTYIVQDGDTLSEIANKFKVSQADIAKANSLTHPDNLKLGQSLRIPDGSAESIKLVKGNLTISSQLQGSGSLTRLIKKARSTNPLILASKTTSAQPPVKAEPKVKTSGKAYTVKSGDNDWVIAAKLGTTPTRLRLANPTTKWTRLQIGSKIAIPQGATFSTPVSAIRSRYAKIARDSVVIRRQPATSADKVTTVPLGTLVTVLDRQAGWYKLRFPRGSVGWVRGDLLKSSSGPSSVPSVVASHKSSTRVASSSRTRSHASSSGKRSRNTGIVMDLPADSSDLMKKAFAMKGTRYRYGQSSRSGVDCSGFTSLVYRQQGVKLPRTSRDQSGVGQTVSKDSLKQGDLVFFHTRGSKRINHVGLYIGNGKFIHASSGGGKVQVNSLNDGYYSRRFVKGKRVTK